MASLCVQFAMLTASAGDKTVYYPDAKSLGMGSARIAGGFGYNGFVDNPALLSRVDKLRISFIPAPLMINNNLLDNAKFIDDNQDKFEDFDELTVDEKNAFLDDIQEYDGKWGRVNLEPMLSMAMNLGGQSIGLAVYNTTGIGFKIDRGAYEPRVWGEGHSNTVVALGYARPLTLFTPNLTVGANLRMLERRTASLFQISASELGNASETLDPVKDELKSRDRNMLLDIGALWRFPVIALDAGATVSSLGDGRGASIDAGVAKRLMNDRVLILADVIDITDNNRENIFKKIHAGVQYQYEFFALRGGINSGYPALGLGLDFRAVYIDAAWFWQELGNSPGVNEDERMMVHIGFGW